MMILEQHSVIEKALNSHWANLDELIQQHYAIYPGQSSEVLITGNMSEIYHSSIAKMFLLPGRLFGALVPYKGKNIPTVVKNWTREENHKSMFWHRTLTFPGKKPVIFASRMEHIQDNEIIEYVRYGMGIRMKMSVEDGALVFKSKDYIWNIGSIRFLIPTWLLLGEALIIEKAISKEEFFIDFKMTHPLFGKTFSYSGNFKIASKISVELE